MHLLVDDLGVRTVLDLRTDGEVHLEGPGPLWADGRVTHHHLTLIPHGLHARRDLERKQTADAEAAADAVDVARAIPDETPSGHEDMSGNYIGYLQDAPTSVARALTLIADSASGGCIAHCAAGKDRTGVVVALALLIVGVRRDAVIDDYLLTGERIEAIRDRLSASPTYSSDMAQRTVDSMRPHARNMQGFLDHLDEEFQGLAGLTSWLGLTDGTVAALRARLLH